MDLQMFQESFFAAAKLLVLASVIALVAILLLTRAACARLVALRDELDPLTEGIDARNGNHHLQRGVRHVYPQPH